MRCVAAGPHYAANPVLRWLLGDDWRDVWTTPAPIPVLDLAAAGGGLRPVRVVGNFQSQGLALAGADGRSYTFRSTDKDASQHLGAPLRYVPFVARAYREGSRPEDKLTALEQFWRSSLFSQLAVFLSTPAAGPPGQSVDTDARR